MNSSHAATIQEMQGRHLSLNCVLWSSHYTTWTTHLRKTQPPNK